jgi:hypothetical protein
MPIDQQMLDEELRRVRESGFGFNPMAGKAAKQKKMRDDRKREEREPTPDPTALDIQAGRQFGFDPNVERLGILPYPRGALTKGSKVDWSDWIAPQVMYEAAKAYALPGYAAQGGDYTPEEVVNMAGTVAGGGMALGRAPAGSLGMMIGPRSKLWDRVAEDLAKKLENEGKDKTEIWEATKTMRAPDGNWRQEIPDTEMQYTLNTIRSKQIEAHNKRYQKAKDKAATPEELSAIEQQRKKAFAKAVLNLSGTASDFVSHPLLFKAYPELSGLSWKELDSASRQFTAPETTRGFYNPNLKRIVINADYGNKRSTALHELQHAIQNIEGWQSGSSPEIMAKQIVDREKAKKDLRETKEKIDALRAEDPVKNASLILDYEIASNYSKYIMNKTRQLEGIKDPFEAYKRVSGEEEARMVEQRRNLTEDELKARPPVRDYEYSPSEHIYIGQGGVSDSLSTDKGGLPKPLTKKQFEKQFAQHIDIRGRKNKSQEENMRAILEEGFRRGFGPNAVPPYAGGAPLNIMSERFQPQSGDVVYLAPQSAWQKTPNGMQIVEGWKPEPQNIVRVQDPNQSMYEAYIANLNKPEGVLPKVNRLDMNYKDVGKRVPALTEAAQKVDRGELTASQYDEIVNSQKPVTPYSFVPSPATAEDATRALDKNKRLMFGKTKEIEPGEITSLRLDIPAYQNHGVWVNSIHRKNQPTVYGSVSSVKNATMFGAPDKAFRVATGESSKGPWATITGEWNPVNEAEAVKMAQEYLHHKDWRQVGYDPERHGYFYDRTTMEPITGAQEVLQIGPLVLAKKPTYGKKSDQKYKKGGQVTRGALSTVTQ